MPLELPAREPCPFCENAAGRYAWHGPPAVIAEDEHVITFLNPASLGGMEGHALVITRRHIETIFDLTESEEIALIRAVTAVARALRAVLEPDGVLVQQHNGVAAFQTVPHVHVHVVPKRGDGPFPPKENVDVTPQPERQRLARLLAEHL